jgi:translocation and assembly module TamB
MRWFMSLALVAAVLMPHGGWAQETAAEREDRGTITAFLEDNLSGAGRQVVIRGFQGALSSRATATQMTIADDDGVWLTLNDIVLDWNRAAILAGRVSVNELTAKEIIVARAPGSSQTTVPAPEASGFALPDLPVSVDIGQIAAERVVLEQPVLGQAFEGTIAASLQLAGGEGQATLSIQRLDAGPAADISLNARYTNLDRTLTLDLSAVEEAGGLAATVLNLPGAPSVELTVAGQGPLDDFKADLVLNTNGQKRLAGSVTLMGADSGAQRFSVDFGGDVAPLFLPQYADFFGREMTLSAQGQREASGRVALSAFDLAARSVRLAGQVTLAADGLPEQFSLVGDLGDPSGATVLLPGAEGEVSLQSATLDLGYDKTQGETWRAAVTGRGLGTATADVDGFSLTGSGRIGRVGSDRLIGGTISSRLQGVQAKDAALATALGSDVQLDTRFWWTSGAGELRFGGLSLAAGDVSLTGSGAISNPTAGIVVEGSATVTAKDMARFSGLVGRSLSGGASVNLAGQGSVLGGTFDAKVQVEGQDLTLSQAELDGLLRGASRLSLDARRDETGTLIRALTISASSLEAQGKGQISSTTTDLTLDFSMPDISVLGPTYGGGASGTARLNGALTQQQARVEANITGQNLALGQAELDRLLQGETTLSVLADLDGDVLQIEALDLSAPSATAQVQGKLAISGSDLAVRLDLADLGRIVPGYGGRIGADLTVKGTPEAAMVTASAEAGSLRIGQAEVDRVLAGASVLNATVRLDQGQLRLDDLALKNAQVDVSATGRVTGTQREIDMTARLANLGLLLADFPGPVTVQGTAAEDAAGYVLNLSGTGPGQINGRITGRVGPNFRNVDLNIAGTAQAGLANPFIGTRVVSGPISLALRVSGPPALSSVSGRVALTEGRLADPNLPFTVQGISAAVDLSGGQARINSTASVSTGGNLNVNGVIGLTAPYNSDLQVGLVSVVLRDPQLYQTRANGTLSINGPLVGGAVISGRVALPETELRIAATGLGTTGDLAGLRHVNEPVAVRETRRRAGLLGTTSGTGGGQGRPFGLDIVISAPNRFFIRGRGLDAELGGELRLTGTSDNVIPTGAFNLIRGRLDILGRRLVLSEAQLQLQGDFDPLLAVAASTISDGITSSVRIDGSATDPQVSFTSSPELPEEEVLAQLLFGRRLDSLSAFQALQLANAVATLAGRGGDGIISRLRTGFGLDDLDVQTSADGQTQLTAGKYLSENVYSEVVVDQTGKSQINLNLDLSDTLTLKGAVGADGNTGIGLFFEKDY